MNTRQFANYGFNILSIIILIFLVGESVKWGWDYMRFKGLLIAVGIPTLVVVTMGFKGLRGRLLVKLSFQVVIYYELAPSIIMEKLLHRVPSPPSWTYLAVYGTIFTLLLLELIGVVFVNALTDFQKTFKETNNT